MKHPFKFTETGLDRGVDVDNITIEYKKNTYVTSFNYNEMTGKYDRYRNGEPYYDGLNGMNVDYSNVIVLRTSVTWYNGASQRPVIQLVGQGNGLVPIEGIDMAGGGLIQFLQVAFHLGVVDQTHGGHRHPGGKDQGMQPHGQTEFGLPQYSHQLSGGAGLIQ